MTVVEIYACGYTFLSAIKGGIKVRLYIIRHAEPDNPNNTLTDAGHLEAQALARRLAQMKIDRMYTSPLARAQITKDYSKALNGLEASTLDWTQEIADSRLELAPWGRLAGWDIPGELWRDGESAAGLLERALGPQHLARVALESDRFFAQHGYVREDGRYRIQRQSDAQLAVFCHNGFALVWLAHLLQLPLDLVWSGFTLAPSSVTTILFDERSSTWAVPRCIGLGDTSHLYASGLPISSHGIKANIF
jgi:probable phosphoglycerate mutase